MNKIKIPDQLEGQWNDAVFLTYGVDLPFFERAIWRCLDKRCTNIIIIGDGDRITESYKGFADTLNVRWLNQKYIVNPIHGTTFHCKLILLTSAQKGRLLVGSGNLGFQGYASGGEMFVQYEYDQSSKIIEYLPVFISAINYFESLILNNHIFSQTEKQLRKLLDGTPWLFSEQKSVSALRSNIESPFIDQFISAVNNEAVEELVILSPFFDKKAEALENLIKRLNPNRVSVYLQEGETSIDPQALAAVSDHIPERLKTFSVNIFDGKVYIHNKLYIAKTKNRSICLQGSPNLTKKAFLTCPPFGNFELANLLIGSRDEFNHLIESLNINKQISDYSKLNCEFIESQNDKGQAENDPLKDIVIGGEWQRDYLKIFFRGELPDISITKILIDNFEFNLEIKTKTKQFMVFETNADLLIHLAKNLPIFIIWNNEKKSNPIFLFNLEDLNKNAEFVEDDQLSYVGDFEFEDKELESLLFELDNSLIIDKQSVNIIWQTEKSNSHKEGTIDEDLRINYSEINYELLCSHPKLAQYREWQFGGKGYRKTNLQIILSSITDHFQGLIDATENSITPSTTKLPIEDIESDLSQENTQEIENQEVEKESKRASGNNRMKRIMKTFIRRYLKGIINQEFLKLVDFDVIANNYVIFSHILWRLFAIDWVEKDFIIESFLKMFRFMWGETGKKGYYQNLNQHEKALCAEILQKGNSGGRLIAAIFYANYLTTINGWSEQKMDLRDFWRHYIINWEHFLKTKDLKDAWYLIGQFMVYDAPIPTKIIRELQVLTDWETEKSFLRSIETRLNWPENSIRFSQKPVEVYKPLLGNNVQIRQLEITNIKNVSQKDVEEIFHKWMSFEKKDLYRIASLDNNIIAKYDPDEKLGLFFNSAKKIDKEFSYNRNFPQLPFELRMKKLAIIAREADWTLLFNHNSIIEE